MNVALRFLLAAFAGMALWLGAFAAPASADETASTIAPPAVRLGQSELCRVVVPMFEPVGRRRAAVATITFRGGAKVSSLVAAPCRRAAPSFDV